MGFPPPKSNLRRTDTAINFTPRILKPASAEAGKDKIHHKKSGNLHPGFFMSIAAAPYILGRLLVPLGPFFSHFTSRTVPVSLTRTTGTYITRLFLFSS